MLKDLIPPPSDNEIVSKLSRHFHDDIKIAIIIRNVESSENFIELLDAFHQARPSNINFGNNGYNLYQNYRFYPNVYGKTFFSNQNNSRERNYVPNANQNNFGATVNRAKKM